MIPKIRACCRLFVRKCGLLFSFFFLFSCLCLDACFWSGDFKDGYTGNTYLTAFIMSRFQEVGNGGNGIVFAWQMGSLSLYRNGGLCWYSLLSYKYHATEYFLWCANANNGFVMCDVLERQAALHQQSPPPESKK
ncbi:hypothetical protein V8C42DRAFT_126814 [Trichoderma barbatum]